MSPRSGISRPAQRPFLPSNLKFVDSASADAGFRVSGSRAAGGAADRLGSGGATVHPRPQGAGGTEIIRKRKSSLSLITPTSSPPLPSVVGAFFTRSRSSAARQSRTSEALPSAVAAARASTPSTFGFTFVSVRRTTARPARACLGSTAVAPRGFAPSARSTKPPSGPKGSERWRRQPLPTAVPSPLSC